MAGQTINVSIMADTKKFSSAMKKIGSSTGLSKLGSKLKSVGSKMVNFFKTGVKWAAALAAALLGLAIKGGFERMLKIEDATAKLKGLGHSARDVDAIMDDALNSVKGTAFGLDEAATAAANAVASGIEPGQDLERQLRLIGDAATIAGTDFNEMGGIFNKINASNRVSMREVNQLMQRGIPILQMLGDQFGVTADEVRDMVSSGQVDAAAFADAMEDRIGGAALEAGNTTRGAFANMKAALSRFGVALIEDVFPMFKDAFLGITNLLDNATDAVKPLGEAFGKWIRDTALPAVQSLGRWIKDRLWPVLQDVWGFVSGSFTTAWQTVKDAMDDAGLSSQGLSDTLSDGLLGTLETVGQVVGTAVEKLGDFIAFLIRNKDTVLTIAAAFAGLFAAFQAIQAVETARGAISGIGAALQLLGKGGVIGLVIAGIAALVGALVWFFTKTETGQAIVAGAWEKIQGAIAAVVDWWQTSVAPVVEEVWGRITATTSAFLGWWNANVAPVIDASADLIRAIFERLAQVAGVIFGILAAAWSALWGAIRAVWKRIGPPVMEAIEGAWRAMQIITSTVWNLIKKHIETVLGVIESIIRAITAAIRGDWDGFGYYMRQAAQRAWDGIKGLVRIVLDGIKALIANAIVTVRKVWSAGWNSVKQLALDVWNGIKTGIQTRAQSLLAYVRSIPSRIIAFFAGAASWLIRAGRNIMSGFLSGLRAGWDAVTGFVGGIGSWIADHKGPKAYDLALLVPAGQWIIQGLQTGMESQIPALKRTLGTITDTVADTTFQPLDASAAARTVKVNPGEATSETHSTTPPQRERPGIVIENITAADPNAAARAFTREVRYAVMGA